MVYPVSGIQGLDSAARGEGVELVAVQRDGV